MHPEITRQLAQGHRDDLHREAAANGLARIAGQPAATRPRRRRRPAIVQWAVARLASARSRVRTGSLA
jgi:hypothetical protein